MDSAENVTILVMSRVEMILQFVTNSCLFAKDAQMILNAVTFLEMKITVLAVVANCATMNMKDVELMSFVAMLCV